MRRSKRVLVVYAQSGTFRLGQSPFRSDIHSLTLPSCPYCAISLATLYRPSRGHRVHSTRSTSSWPSMSPKTTSTGHEASRLGLGIFRPMSELVDRKPNRVPFIHSFHTDDTFFNVAFRRPRIRHRIKRTAMATKEGSAFRNRPYKRHCEPSNHRSEAGSRGGLGTVNKHLEHGSSSIGAERQHC
jgi:hypothetical protein